MIKVMNLGIMNMDHQLNIKTFIFNSFRENCYLLWDAVGNCVIVDPGCYWPEEFARLREFIAAEGLTPKCGVADARAFRPRARGAEDRPGIFSAGADVAGGQDDSGQQSGGREGVRAGSA